jgi:hypothetical protein
VERRVGTLSGSPDDGGKDLDCEPLDPSRIEAVGELDRASFGADRTGILRGFLSRPRSTGWLYRTGSEVDGYLVGREGSRFFHVGPWVATTEAAARALWTKAAACLEGRVVGVDVPVPNELARTLAEEAGLPVVRSLTRMLRAPRGDPSIGGRDPRAGRSPGGRPDRVFALAGFEWG